jgi:hypothetical protein
MRQFAAQQDGNEAESTGLGYGDSKKSEGPPL